MSDVVNTTVKISGISCDACIRLITKRVSAIKGVQDVIVDNDCGKTTIVANRKLSLEDIQFVLSDTDYTISTLE